MIIFVDDPWVNISLFIPLYKSVPLSRKSHVYVLLTFGIIFVSNNRKSKQVRENDFCCSRGEQGFLTRESWKEICTLRIILVKGNRGEICTLQPECQQSIPLYPTTGVLVEQRRVANKVCMWEHLCFCTRLLKNAATFAVSKKHSDVWHFMTTDDHAFLPAFLQTGVLIEQYCSISTPVCTRLPEVISKSGKFEILYYRIHCLKDVIKK